MLLYNNSVSTSPYVLSCFVALREKGLAFETRPVELHKGAQFEPEFQKASLTSRVPVLVDGDLLLSESSAIVEYLEEAYPAPKHARVLPEGVRERARARQVMAWIRSDLMPIREQRSSECVFYPHAELGSSGPRPLDEAGRHAKAKLLTAAEMLVPASGDFLFGQWCVADTDLAMMLERLIKCGDEVPPRLREYAERQWERPAVKEFRAMRRPAFHHVQDYPKGPVP
jgi:glutathione S-transferase